jgi:hypothetical protein
LVGWFVATDEDRIQLSVITLAELRRGIERSPSVGGAPGLKGG